MVPVDIYVKIPDSELPRKSVFCLISSCLIFDFFKHVMKISIGVPLYMMQT